MAFTSLQLFITAVLSGSVALGPAVYQLFERVAFFSTLDSQMKRIAVALVSALLGVAVWFLALGLGYISAPAETRSFIEAVLNQGFLSGLAAFTSSTLIHGATYLSDALPVEAITSPPDGK